jgi:hypothetical protein
MKTRSMTHVFLFVGILLIAGLACKTLTPSAETPPPVATMPPVEVLPTEPPALPPAEVPTEPPVQPAEQYFTENFDSEPAHWYQQVELNSKEGDMSQASVTVEDGYLSFDLGKWLIAYMFYDGAEYENVRVDVNVDNRGTNVNNVLLVCRISDEGHYLVNIANSGLFAMYAYKGENQTYQRISNGGSTKIKSGKAVNEYSLVCRDRTIIIYINGTEARRYTDNDYVFRKGGVGIGVASEDQLPVRLEFDWVKISEP